MPAPSLNFKVEPTSDPSAFNDSSVMKRPRETVGGSHPARSPIYTVEKEKDKEKTKDIQDKSKTGAG
jgi:hypothetical protein